MEILLRILLSLFFAAGIGFHVYAYFIESPIRIFYHAVYILTYSVCWAMIYSKSKNRSIIYLISAIYPFLAHVYYGYNELPDFNTGFFICLTVTVFIPLGWLVIRREEGKN